MAKKSAAKIRRNASRAAARGEEYTPPESTTTPTTIIISGTNDNNDDDCSHNKGQTRQQDDVVAHTIKYTNAAQKLEETLSKLPPTLNAKERRSAKRKAEAIALEESGCSNLNELMDEYAQFKATIQNSHRTQKSTTQQNKQKSKLTEEEEILLESAKKLHNSLAEIEMNAQLNAKERRSAKRKAEAIAVEETGGKKTAMELLQLYKTIVPSPVTVTKGHSENKKSTSNNNHIIPYILFVGQLSYTTTSDMLFEHFQSTLGTEVISSKEKMKIRLLIDSKTNKSRGMAFIEVESPEIMYECLKLHLTYLDGRRINVERSAGGGTVSKKARISHFRASQSRYISETMDNILASFTKNGDIETKELDEGVIALCKRHSASVVEAALREYVEEKKERKIKYEESLRGGSNTVMKKNKSATAREGGEKKKEEDDERGRGEEGLEFRNPSAFLTHMIGRIAEEGMGNLRKDKKRKSCVTNTVGRGTNDKKENDEEEIDGSRREIREGKVVGGLKHSSILQKSGVDMSISLRQRKDDTSHKIERIFPSMTRGRGRGRGYM